MALLTAPRLGLLALLGLSAPAAEPAAPAVFKDVQLAGQVTASDGGLTVAGKAGVVAVHGGTADHVRVTADLVLAAQGGPVHVVVGPSGWAEAAKPAAGRVDLRRDKDGLSLTAAPMKFDPDTKAKWVPHGAAVPYHYWPLPTARGSAAQVAALTDAGLKPQTWHGRRLRLTADADPTGVNVWLDGMFVRRVPRDPGAAVTVALHLSAGDRVAAAAAEPVTVAPAAAVYLPLDIGYLVNDSFAKPTGKTAVKAGPVPFALASGAKDHVSLRHAHWAEVKKDPSSYYESYDYGPAVVGDPTMPMLRVPVADYAAVHLLAVADDDPELTNTVTLRCGRYGGAGQVLRYDVTAAVPRRADAAKSKGAVETPAGPLVPVRVPLPEAFAQDLSDVLEIEVTKEVRLARRQPDPNRFRERPLGNPSGVRIVAVTLEKAPLQMRVTSRESGHAFVEPQRPAFQVRLQNVTAAAQPYRLTAEATHLDGTKTKAEAQGEVPARAAADVALDLPDAKRGYHDVSVTLRDRAGRPVLERKTSFARLAPDTRKHRDTSPFGTWDFFGGHFTSSDPDKLGPLYVKLGLRFSMMRDPAGRAKYGLVPGSEPKAHGSAAVYQKARTEHPDTPRVALLFHEDSISGRHVTRVPDLFTDRPPYQLDEAEEKRFKAMWEAAEAGAKAVRALDPKAHLRFGNGPLPTKEEFYRRKFPAELFDSGGNEAGSFGRPPEAQPPDFVANNASLWMDRQLLDGYGYGDKPVTQCYEVCYPATNPGNLDERTQADYQVRHTLHALAWGIKEFRPGCISDMGNSYYFSNWGATGFCRRHPELSVKPAFVAFSTLTRVLDGAKFVRVVPAGSDSVYAIEFDRPDGSRAYALWTLRGKRPAKLTVQGGPWTVVDDQGAETPLAVTDGTAEVVLSPSVVYVVGKGSVGGVAPGTPTYTDAPAGGKKAVVLSPLADLTGWAVEAGRNPELEFYNFMAPRRKGDFAFEPVKEFDGQKGAVKITPRPVKTGKDTMPMYGVLAHAQGIPVAGTPTEFGVWVNGNSGWGRVMFEFTDASGQRWVSLGAQQRGENRWLEDMVPKDLLDKFPTPGLSDWNTEDVFGASRVNFDGWRYVAFPLPGNYPGEKYPWPANSQWRWDKDGVVHYPLTFRKLVVELPEKVLRVRDYAPPGRPEVYLRGLTAGYGPPPAAKAGGRE